MKSPEELRKQTEQAEATLGTSFFSTPEELDKALSLDEKELKEKYPNRYEQYTKILRRKNERTGEQGDERTKEQEEEMISVRNYILMTKSLEQYVAGFENNKELWDHQKDVFRDIEIFFNEGKNTGFIDMPTGTGKTRVFILLTKALAGFREKKEKPVKTLILVPKQDLLEQSRTEFQKLVPESEMSTSAYFEREQNLNGQVVFMTYDSLNNLMKDGKLDKNLFDLIICDEAHTTLSEIRQENISALAPNGVKIGVTATTEYSEDKKVKQLFKNEIHRLTFDEAIETGILANANGFLVKTGIKANLSLSGDEYTLESLKKLDIPERNRKAVAIAKELAEKGIPGIISCIPGNEVEQARKIADMINEQTIIDPKTGEERNMRAKAVWGNSAENRPEIYEAYAKGEYDFLTFVDILKEGWDCPSAKALINLRPTRSKVFSIQRLGRVLRKYIDPITKLARNAMVFEFEDEITDVDKKPFTIFDIFNRNKFAQGESMVEKADSEPVKMKTVPSEKMERNSLYLPEKAVTVIKKENDIPLAIMTNKNNRILVNERTLLNYFKMTPNKVAAVFNSLKKNKTAFYDSNREPINFKSLVLGGEYYDWVFFKDIMLQPLYKFLTKKKSLETNFTVLQFLDKFDIDTSFASGVEKFLKHKSIAYSAKELRQALDQYLTEKLKEVLKEPEKLKNAA